MGSKRITAFGAEAWALTQYETRVRDAQAYSIKISFLSTTFLIGVTGAMFYVTYTFAFVIGTEQVKSSASMISFIQCLFDDSPDRRVTGASIMCCCNY